MRRQGFEFAVSRPQVIYKKDENGKLLEPMELLMIEVPEQYVGAVMEKLGARKAEIVNMGTRDTGVSHLEFRIPARGLMGYRQQFLTDTNGNGIMNSVFDGYEPYKGDNPQRVQGSLVAFETGETSGYGLFNAQDRDVYKRQGRDHPLPVRGDRGLGGSSGSRQERCAVDWVGTRKPPGGGSPPVGRIDVYKRQIVDAYSITNNFAKLAGSRCSLAFLEMNISPSERFTTANDFAL